MLPKIKKKNLKKRSITYITKSNEILDMLKNKVDSQSEKDVKK